MRWDSNSRKNLLRSIGSSWPFFWGDYLYFVLKFFAACIGRLDENGLERIARGFTWLFWDILRVRRRLVLKNLHIAFGSTKSEAELSHIGRESVRNFALTILELFWSSRNDVVRQVTLKNDHFIRDALAPGKGVFILCCHLGNWETMGAACTRLLTPSHVLVKKVGSASVNRFVEELRENAGFIGVKRAGKGAGYRAIKDALARGEVVGFVMDQARPGEPKFPFFGKLAKTNTSLAGIWPRNRAPIVPAFITRQRAAVHTLEFLPALAMTETGNEEEDVRANTAKFNQAVEEMIRHRPEQYFWMHDRWKE